MEKDEQTTVLQALEPLLDTFEDSAKQIKRSILIIKGLSELGWMNYTEIKKYISRMEGHTISDNALQNLLNKLVKNNFIFKVAGFGEKKNPLYIISEKGLWTYQATHIPMPSKDLGYTNYLHSSDPFTERINAFIAEAEVKSRVLSLRSVRTEIVKGLGEYKKILELIYERIGYAPDYEDIQSLAKELSNLNDEEKKKFHELIDRLKNIAELLNKPHRVINSIRDASSAYRALLETENHRKEPRGIDYVLIYVKPDGQDGLKLSLYKYSTLTVATILLSILGTEIKKPFIYVLYVEGPMKAVEYFHKIMAVLREEYNRVRAWNLIAEDMASGIDCCPDQTYELFSEQSLLIKPLNPESTIILFDEALTRNHVTMDLSKIDTLLGDNVTLVAKGDLEITVSKPTTIIEVVEKPEITVQIKGAYLHNKIPVTLILLGVQHRISEDNISIKLDTNKISIFDFPVLVKRVYGEGIGESKQLLPGNCEISRLIYNEKSLFEEPDKLVEKIINLVSRSTDDRIKSLHWLDLFDFTEYGFSCEVKNGLLMKGNGININVINSNNIFIKKLYIINKKVNKNEEQ